MPQIDELRSKLLEHGARFAVVKNTLTRRAAEAAGNDALLALLEGPTAIAFLESGGDPVAVAKALVDAARDTRVLAVRGGLLEGRPVEPGEIESLAKLPPVDVLRAPGGRGGGRPPPPPPTALCTRPPLTAIVGLFTAPLQNLYGLLDARIEQLGAEQPQAEAAPEPEAAPAAEAPSEPEPEPQAKEAETETETEAETQEEEQ